VIAPGPSATMVHETGSILKALLLEGFKEDDLRSYHVAAVRRLS
jgi:hypothetical protein